MYGLCFISKTILYHYRFVFKTRVYFVPFLKQPKFYAL